MEFTYEQWIFMIFFFSIWFVLSFVMIILYAIWEDKNKYSRYIFTVKDIFIMVLMAPFTIVCGAIYLIMWFILRVLHFEDLIDAISDFMNKPIKLKKENNNGN